MNLARLGEDNVGTYGEYVSLVFEDVELTNVEQLKAANRLANALHRLGVGPDSRVVVMLPNCPEVLPSLPKSPIGKILRKELRAQATLA